MDLDQIKNLSPEQKQAYMDLSRMFESPGWALVKDRMQKTAEDHASRQMVAPNWDQAVLHRGARLAFLEVASLSDTVDHEFALIAASNVVTEELEDETKFE